MSAEENLLKLAEAIAVKAHEGQFRRGGVVPYIEHPKAVSSRVGGDLDAMAVAWLHDVIEDSDYTSESLLRAGIPARIVDAVLLLTKTEDVVYEDYLERIAESPLATCVKIADMLSNLADHPTRNQIRKYSKGLLRLTQV